MAAAISQNVSNAGTQGYRRVDVITSEMNFSGPGNVPFLPGGVSTQAVTQDQPWLDGRLNMAVSQDAAAQGFQTTLRDFSEAADTSGMERAFSNFMAVSQEALTNPTNSEVIARLQATLGGFVVSVNQFEERVQQSLARQEAQQQFTADELGAENIDPMRSNELMGEMQGRSRALNGPILDIMTDINNILAQVETDINSVYGKDIIGRNPSNGRMVSNFEEGGNFTALSEFSSQQFNTDLGATQSALGVALQSAENNRQFTQSEVQGAQQAWDDVYGVNLTQEAVKLKETQLYQQANAAVFKVASEMTDTLISLMA